MTFVVSLGDLGLAGGKGANLGELVRAGLPVPGGFIAPPMRTRA
jgi:rifampicin phosphotransferase